MTMSPVSLASLTLADLEDTLALDAIRSAAALRGVAPEVVLSEVVAEPLTLDEITVGLQTRADRMIDAFYEEQALLPGLAEA
ncbi:MAG: hypothetical protein ACYC4P_11550 [Thermoanaerobaculia bacterium]